MYSICTIERKSKISITALGTYGTIMKYPTFISSKFQKKKIKMGLKRYLKNMV